MIRTSDTSLLCSITGTKPRVAKELTPTSIQLWAILYYATSHVVPQQSLSEIKVTFDVLKSMNYPSNFLAFELGHDSLMWPSINLRGTTIFLEEDPKWVQTILKDAPGLHAYTVLYHMQLQEVDQLLSQYCSESYCSLVKAYLWGNNRCKLGLHNLPDEIYEKEWDLIMIDASCGCFAEALSQMGMMFSTAVMARNKKGSCVTHVFLHDVDRKVERTYIEEFCVRRTWSKALQALAL